MNWAIKLRWRVAVPTVATIAALAATALPAAAQAAGTPGPGAASKVPSFKVIPHLTPGVAAQPPAVLPQPGTTPAFTVLPATSSTPSLPVAAYTGTDSKVYAAPTTAFDQAVSLGGHAIGGPAMISVPPPMGRGLAIFARGGNNALYLGGATSTGSPTWLSLGGGLSARPGAAAGALSVPGGEAVDAVVRSGNGSIYDREITSTTVKPWRSLGGSTMANSGPGAVNVGGTLYVLVLGTNGTVYYDRSTDGVHWSGYKSLGGRATGDVGVASPARGVGIVFVHGANNVVWYNQFVGTTKGISPGWHSLGGRVTSGVGAGSAPNGSMAVVALGPDSHIWSRSGTWPKLSAWVGLF